MKIKRYEVTLTTPDGVHIAPSCNQRMVRVLFEALDELWCSIDFEEWTLEVSPYWEEVPDNA